MFAGCSEVAEGVCVTDRSRKNKQISEVCPTDVSMH